MSKDWLSVFAAAFFEVFWVIGLKHASTIPEWIGTAICILISFYLLIMTGKKLPVGTAYAVFVGLGTMGTVLSEILFFGEPVRIVKLAMIALLLAGVIGLKIVTPEDDAKGEELT